MKALIARERSKTDRICELASDISSRAANTRIGAAQVRPIANVSTTLKVSNPVYVARRKS